MMFPAFTRDRFMADADSSACHPVPNLRLLAIQSAVSVCLLLTMFARARAEDPVPPILPLSADVAITCTVHDALGHPVSGLSVEIRSAAQPLQIAVAPTLSDGSVSFHGLANGSYNVTVAGGILFPPKRVNIDSSNPTVVLHLPITIPQVAGQTNNTVSVEQLTIPVSAQVALHKAYEAWQRDDLKQSRILANRALQLHPNYGPAMSLLGILELNEGRPADAIIGLQRAVRFNPNSPRTYLALASAYNELHNHTDALHALSIFKKLSLDSWQLHYEVGRAYLGQGRYEASLDEFDLSQQLAQQELIEIRIARAHALMGLRDYPAARAELQTAIRKSPKTPQATESRKLVDLLDAQLKKLGQPIEPATRSATMQGSIRTRAEH